MNLERSLEVRIKEICDEGDVLIEMGDLKEAFENFSEALSLVPDPKPEYRVTAGILAGLGNVYFHAKSFSQGQEVLADAMHCAGASGSPFLHLRLGQCQFELKTWIVLLMNWHVHTWGRAKISLSMKIRSISNF
jgi:hypothetical protein